MTAPKSIVNEMEINFIDAFPTLFLPKDLPTMPLVEQSEGLRNERDSVLECWKDFLANGDVENPVLLDVASAFVDLHLDGGSEQPNRVEASLAKTKVGGYWGYHVRAQNAAVLIYRETEDKALFMAWQVQSPNHDVTNNVSISQTLPQVVLRVPWEKFRANIYSLVDLAKREQPLAIPVSVKAGKSFGETRDVNNPFFVLDVLASALGGDVLPKESCSLLEKKMADEVRYMSSELPWRREPVYAVLKNILHLVCLRETKEAVDYKMMALRLLAYCLDKVGCSGGLSHSQVAEASRKIIRRREKLRELPVLPPAMAAVDAELGLVLQRALMNVKLDWEIRSNANDSIELDVPLKTMQEALSHTLPNSGSVLAKLSEIGGNITTGANSENTDVAPPDEYGRLRQWSPFRVADIETQTDLLTTALGTRFGKAPQDFIGTMHDICEGILDGFEHFQGCDDPDNVALALVKLEKTFIDVGLKETSPFHDDVRSRSEVILVAFTICLLIDKIACSKHPLLLKHKLLGIEKSGIFDQLFLPKLKYKKHLSLVEAYLNQREEAPGPPALEACRSVSSFAVQYAKNSYQMEHTRIEIMNQCEELQRRKRIEKNDKQNQYNNLMRCVRARSCSCHYRERHGWVKCGRCIDEANANQIYIQYHEKYLPSSLHLQQAVVFELQTPRVLACQRDCFILFAESVCKEEWHEESDFVGHWRDEASLSRWRDDMLPTDRMKLGSTTKKVTQSHYSQGHVSAHHDFVVNHGFGVRAMGPTGPMVDVSQWKWNVSHHTTMKVPVGPYHSLQEFFNSYSHSENKVIALKSEASEELSLHEFEEVGCLRAGPSLQLSRLLSGLQQNAYSMERDEVVSLICCVLWQVGPQATVPDDFRESCSILRLGTEFALQMCQMLDVIIANCKLNWATQNTLLSVVHIGRHLFEHATEIRDMDALRVCSKVLLEARRVSIDWINKLLVPLCECTDDDTRQNYRQRIVDISAMGTLTYFNDNNYLLRDAGDVQQWSFLRAVFHDNYSPNELLEPSWRRPHLLHCMDVAEQVAPGLRDILDTNEGSRGLSMFLCDYWTASQGGNVVAPWARCTGSSDWVSCRFDLAGSIKIVQFDFVGGSFLVDGSSCTRLPKEITAHPIYRRLFGSALFLVQPLGENAYRTGQPVNGFYFEFYSSCFNPSLGFGDNPLIIMERVGGTQERAVLVPDSTFRSDDTFDDFPEMLIQDQSHWFVLHSKDAKHLNKLYFRPLKYTDPNMTCPLEKDEYVLEESFLVEQASGDCFLDVQSIHFQNLYHSVFCRLNPARFVHVKMCPRDAHEVKIELPRLHHLSFTYDGESIQAQQLGGLQVAQKQNLGTFVGLKHGVLLEDPKNIADKVFLCPNGSITRSGNATSIDTEPVMNPPYFQYSLRPELCDLKLIGQGRLGWLFLALLHAQTSDLMEDPFTKCTGTKRSLDILRLGCCQGNLVTSTDDDNLRELLLPEMKLLGQLAKISIGRKNYHGMEQVTVGPQPALCAHDAFSLIAIERLECLMNELCLIGKHHLVQNEYEFIREGCFAGRTGLLIEKSYLQRRKYYPLDSCLNKEEEGKLSTKLNVVPLGAMTSRLDKAGRGVVQEIGLVAQNSEVTLSHESSSLEMLLDNKTEVAGFHEDDDLNENVVLLFDNMIRSRKGENQEGKGVPFHDVWLQLYWMAHSKCHEITHGQTLFGSLLTFVAAHYPGEQGYLQDLVIVAKHRDLFPSSPSHNTYELTNEVSFVSSRVDDLIERHLESFTKAKPSSWQPDYRKREWQSEKSHHEQVNRESRVNLLSLARRIFDQGGYVSQRDASLPHVCKCAQLAEELKDLFDRWRQSKELKMFREAVAKRLRELKQRRRTIVPRKLDRFESRPWPKRASFQLATQSTSDFHIDEDFQQRLEDISVTGRLKYAYEKDVLSCSGGGKKASPFSVYSPGDINPSELALFKKLAMELHSSVEGALDLPKQSFEFFDDSQRIVDVVLDLLLYKERSEQLASKIWALLEDSKRSKSHLLPLVGLWDSTTPWNVLSSHFKPSNLNELKCELGAPFAGSRSSHLANAFAVAIKHAQRARRCLTLLRRGKSAYPHLGQDITSQGCAGWTPIEYPEFLAFEIDNNLGIREQQAQVVREVLRNDLGNRLLQMNMGGGKSSVIMPLVLCAAACGDSISRGTVLSALYATNTADWQSKVGGLLARQIFPLICCRDISLDAGQASELRRRLDMIREGRHILVTVPEHRLSLENKAIEACVKDRFDLGRGLLEVINELCLRAREFIDESDEIASPKYQLVYPLGGPQDMEGAQIRWLLHAGVLQSVSHHASELYNKFGSEVVELVEMDTSSYQYSAIRLLDGPQLEEAYRELCSWIIDDVLRGIVPLKNGLKLRIHCHERLIWKRCALGEEIKPEDMARLESDKLQHSALCLRGILSHDILLLVLQKRIRVEYGAHPFRKHYQMAVPYRAKDVAAERSDFAHPDVCLGLTIVAYYQCGLSEEQLFDVFKKLSSMSDAADIYSTWTDCMDESIGNFRSFSAINLDDRMLFKQVYPMFRRHFQVVDFWLMKMIFPAQAKQYKMKLTATAVDLFKSKELIPGCNAVTTGFSGTDDLSLVLPPTVRQQNLKELSATNGIQILSILRPENNTYYSLGAQEAGVSEHSTNMILELLRETEISTNVVLDAGALILHMSNEEFARAWLKQRTDCDACVFFKKDIIVFVSRRDDTRMMPFSGSQFEEDMSKCLLYLDDEHTRGSDFQLPLDARAFVTLGKGMNKDKFVQACMRMRQIGKGQQLAIVAPHDVHVELERFPCDVGNEASQLSRVVNWTLRNTSRRLCDLVPYFVSQTVCSMRKSRALQQHYYGDGTASPAKDEDLAALADSVVEMEELRLIDMYFHPRGQKTLLQLTKERLGSMQGHEVGEIILNRVKNIAPDAKRYCSLHDEEQEVEQEQELDEERQNERPPPEQPAKRSVSQELQSYIELVRSAAERHAIMSRAEAHQFFVNTLGFKPFSRYFKKTPFTNQIGEQLNESLVFVTSDFNKTIRGKCDKMFYLKRFRWIIRPAWAEVKVAILISNYEAEVFCQQVMEGVIEPFTPWLKAGQLNLDNTDPESLPAELHVFGGSVNATGPTLDRVKSYLGLHPSSSDTWGNLFEDGVIESDGFVPPSKRQGISVDTPFNTSPINTIIRFLADARHLGSEMRTSVLGQMIEMSEKDLETNYGNVNEEE